MRMPIPNEVRLSDTQLVLLSHASTRDNLAVLPVPDTIKAKGAGLNRSLAGLLSRGLITETAARRSDPQWRLSEDGRPLTLSITDAGLEALGIEPPKQIAARKKRRPVQGSDTAGAGVGRSPRAKQGGNALRSGSKGADVLAILTRTDGASLDELMQASGWQAHSVRGFLSGTVKKKLGLDLGSQIDGNGKRRYRIADATRAA